MRKHQDRPVEPLVSVNPTQVGWRPNEWAHAVGVSRWTAFQLLRTGKIAGVKIGSARVIITSPRAYLTSLAAEACSLTGT
jgi:hypothetical protein